MTDMLYNDETCQDDPDYEKCGECEIWNHVEDRGTYSAVHADDCSHLVEP